MATRKNIRKKKRAPAGRPPAGDRGPLSNPLEERSRYPREGSGSPRGPAPAGPPGLEEAKPERVDPATRTPIEEPEATDLEGQEGVGPGPRDAIRRQEQGLPDPEEES